MAHNTNYLDTPEQAGRASAALANALAEHDLVDAFKAAAQDTGKTWVFHIILFILPRTIYMYGKPWPFSTAKLESRGKSMQDIALHQTSGKPASAEYEIVQVTNPDRGGEKSTKSGLNKTIWKRNGSTNNQMKTLLAKATLKEDLALAKNRPLHRQSEQLMTIGKKTITTTLKAETNRDARWVGRVPDGVPFTVEGLMVAMLQGKCTPLYTDKGKHCANALLPVDGLDVF